MGHLRDLCDADNAVLLVIDVQGKLFELAFNSERLGPAVARLMRVAELFRVPLLLTEQYPRGLGHTAPQIAAIYDTLQTDRLLLEKTSFGCCGEAGFDARLGEIAGVVRARRGGDPGRPVDLIVAGIETHVCVQQTVLALLAQPGYRVVVLQDATGSRLQDCHEIAIARFRQCGAVISCYESVSFEWARSKDDPRFKQLSAIIKG